MINSRFAVDEVGGIIINANGNYAGAGKNFLLKPASGEVFNVTRLIQSIQDAGPFASGNYGGLGAPLTNGITIDIYKNSVKVLGLNDQLPIKQNGQWQALNHDLILSTFGAGDAWQSIRYSFTRETKKQEGIVLDGSNGDEIRVVLNDDFTGITGHYFRFGMDKL